MQPEGVIVGDMNTQGALKDLWKLTRGNSGMIPVAGCVPGSLLKPAVILGYARPF